MRPSLWTLNVTTTCPRIDIAACGMNQLRRICAMKRRIHGPNSTPLVSNWIDGADFLPSPPCGFAKPIASARTSARCGSRRRCTPVGGSCCGSAVRCWAGPAARSARRAASALPRRVGLRAAPVAGCGWSSSRRGLGRAARLDALGGIAPRERQRIGRLRRALDGLRLAVDVREIRARRRLRRLACRDAAGRRRTAGSRARARALAAAAPRAPAAARASMSFTNGRRGATRIRMTSEQVDDRRQQHDFARRQRPREIGVSG